MPHPGEPRRIPPDIPSAGASSSPSTSSAAAAGGADPRVPLMNLSTVQMRMDSVQQLLSQSLNRNALLSGEQMDLVSSEIVSAIHQIIVNGGALLACNQQAAADLALETRPHPPGEMNLPVKSHIARPPAGDLKVEGGFFDSRSDHKDGIDDDCEIVELLAEHTHFCDICGKGFKRDANLRMHIRAHGNQFKTPEALAKPEEPHCPESSPSTKRTRFSCPVEGCNRNKAHKKFRPLKSVICVKNHFKRSHCHKMYSCTRCNKKSFSVLADLRSHMKQCGVAKWKCSCGTSFSRKDKLFGHMALFEGHMPAVSNDNDVDETNKVAVDVREDEDDEESGPNCLDDEFFEGLLAGFGSADSNCFQDNILSFENEIGNRDIFRVFSDI